MAEELVVELVVQDKEAKKALQDFAKTLNETGKAAEEAKKKVTEKPKKGLFGGDFKGQLDDVKGVLGDLLPRDLKMLQRSFKSAQRGTRSFTKGLKGMKAAIASTGIGLFVVALGEVVANWDKIADFAVRASDATRDQVNQALAARTAAEEQLDAISEQENILRLNGATEEDILAMKEAQTTEIINATRLQLEALKQQRDEQIENINWWRRGINSVIGFGVDIVTNFFKFIALKFQGLIKGAQKLGLIDEAFDLQAEISKAGAAVKDMAQLDLVTDLDEDSDLAEQIEETEALLTKYENQRAGQMLRRKEQAERDREEQRRENEKLLEDQEKFLQAQLEKEQEYGKSQEELAVLRLQRQQEQEMERAKSLELSNDELLALEARHARDMDDLIAQQEAARKEKEQSEIEAVQDALKTDLQREIDSVNERYAKLLEAADKYGLDRAALEQQLADKIWAIQQRADAEYDAEDKKIKETRVARMNEFVDNIGGLFGTWQNLVKAQTTAEVQAAKQRGASDKEIENIERKAAERQKRLALIEVLIQQGQAIAAGLAGATQAAAATGPAAPFVLPAYIASMIATIVGGFVQVKNLLNQANAATSGIGRSGQGGGGRSVTQALPNLVSDLSGEAGTFGEEKAVRTYVVASDVQGQNNDFGSIAQNAAL